MLDPELQGAYAGPCVNGLAEGEGVATGAAAYRGGFKAGRKHGKGVKTWPNGDRYAGDFVEDRKEGVGTYAFGRGPWAGERYEGEFFNDRRHGHGVYRWASGDVYSGPWEADRATGAPTPMMVARTRFEEEARAAVGKPGQTVCRALAVGIGARDWVRGTVLEAQGDAVAVRIDDAGTQPHLLGNIELRAGVVISDSVTAWTPCW